MRFAIWLAIGLCLTAAAPGEEAATQPSTTPAAPGVPATTPAAPVQPAQVQLPAGAAVTISVPNQPYAFCVRDRLQQKGIRVIGLDAVTFSGMQVPVEMRGKEVEVGELLNALAATSKETVWWKLPGKFAIIQKGASDVDRETLLNDLKSKDVEQRTLAARHAGDLRDARVIEPLLDVSADPQEAPAVKLAAQESLARFELSSLVAMGGRKALPWIEKGLASDDYVARERAASVLWEVAGADTLPLIMKVQNDKSAGVRRHAPAALIAEGSEASLALAEKDLDDKDVNVVIDAAFELAWAGTDHAMAALEKPLLAKDGMGTSWVAEALGRRGTEPAMALLDKALTSADDRVRAFSMRGLRYAPAKMALPRLERALADRDESVQCGSACYAGESCGEAAMPLLEKTMQDSKWNVRRHCLFGLRDIGTPKAVALMAKLLQDRDERVREDAVISIGMVGGAEAAEIIVARLADRDPKVRAKVPEALYRALADKSADLLIEKALADPTPAVRIQTGIFLVQIHTPQTRDALLGRLAVEKDAAVYKALYQDVKESFADDEVAVAALKKLPEPVEAPPAKAPVAPSPTPATPPNPNQGEEF